MDQKTEEKSGQNYFFWDFVVIITLFCSFGFPGQLENMMGRMPAMVFQYLPFVMQIAIMLLASGQNLMDVKIIRIQKKHLPVYVLLIIFFVLSMMVTPYPQEQVIACVRFSVTALFALWIVEQYDLERILEMCYYAQILFVMVTIVFVILFPGRSFSYENGAKSLTGLFTTKNPFGTEMSLCIVLQIIWYFMLKKKGRGVPRSFIVMLIAQFVLLLMARTTGALFCAALPLLYLLHWYRKKDKVRLPLGLMHFIVSVGFLVFALTIIPLFSSFFEMIGKDATLTGRTPMWQQLIHVMTYHNTMTGFGFTMFWKDPKAVALFHSGFDKGSWGNTMTFGAHCSLLEMWLDVGLIGLAAYFLMLIIAFSPRRVSKMDKTTYAFCSAVIIWLTLKGLTERMYIPFNYQTIFLFLTVGLALEIPAPERKRKVYQRASKVAEPKNNSA